MGRTAKLVVGAGIEWLFLVALWMAFVSQTKKAEFLVGVVVAAIGAFADFAVKRENFAKFEPKFSWVMLGLLLPWYAAKGLLVTLRAFFGQLLGTRPDSQFRAFNYDANANDARSAAKRALAVAYLTIPPNSIVVGIDTEGKQVLMHYIAPTPLNSLEEKLGVKP